MKLPLWAKSHCSAYVHGFQQSLDVRATRFLVRNFGEELNYKAVFSAS